MPQKLQPYGALWISLLFQFIININSIIIIKLGT